MAQPVLFKLPFHKVIFIATPKAGNSSILLAMASALPRESQDIIKMEFPKRVEGERSDIPLIQSLYRDYVISRGEAFLLQKDNFIFTIVRNPWDRVVSHYFDKVNGHRELHARLTPFKEFYYGMPFSEYLNALSKNFDELKDVHILPQVNNIFYRGVLLPNYFMRYERIAEDFLTLKAILGLKNLKATSLPHENKSKRVAYQSMYEGSAQVKIVSQLYRKDIQMFGYSFEEKT